MKLWGFKRPRLTSCAVSLALLLSSTAIRAEQTIWQRARHPERWEERQVLFATQRVLYGTGDKRDMLLARAALVSLSRGTVRSPLLTLLLIRFRRELQLSPARNTDELLRHLSQQDLAPLLRSELYKEWAYLRLRQERPAEADQFLSLALAFAWEPETRLSLLSLRGWHRLSTGRWEEATSDFVLAKELHGDRRARVVALTGLALVLGLRGHAHELDRWAAEAFRLQRSRARVSGAGLFHDLVLDPELRRSAQLIVHWGRSVSLQGGDDERARSLQLDVCYELERDSLGKTATRLKDLWADTCDELIRLTKERSDASNDPD